MKHCLALLVLLNCTMCFANHHPKRAKTKKIVIEILFSSDHKAVQHDSHSDTVEFRSIANGNLELNPVWQTRREAIKNRRVKWTTYTDIPVSVFCPVWRRISKVLSPGDSIFIDLTKDERRYSGKGEALIQLQDEVEKILLDRSGMPTDGWFVLGNVNDYLNWQQYYDKQLADVIPLIDSYEQKVPESLFKYLKVSTVYNIESGRAESFMELMGVARKKGILTSGDLEKICDSTLNKPWARWLRANSEDFTRSWYFYQYNRIQVWRQFGFNLSHDRINTDEKRRVMYYNTLKQNYKGQMREKLLQYVIADEVIKELGYKHPLTQVLLKDYYKQPGFPAYKAWMREYERRAEKLYSYSNNEDAGVAPSFQLIDVAGRPFSNQNIRNKTAVIKFWFTGCTPCAEMTPILKDVERCFEGDSNIVFVNVSVDADRGLWYRSLQQKKYTTGTGINVFTAGKGIDHPMIRDYDVSSYPRIFLISSTGEMQAQVPDPRLDGGSGLIEKLRKMRAEMTDGPYAFYGKDSSNTCYLRYVDFESVHRGYPHAEGFYVSTDQYPESFVVNLKKGLQREPVEFEQPERQFVVSDIEGNFDALRKLLQANKVVDDQFNWSFGKGHLVVIGDVFDRGNQVTECLWLIYSLEEKAKRHGGYVHFILGNHEILNLSNDLRYVRKKYKETAKGLGIEQSELYGDQSELGRWLRTKNIIEKVGDILYTHGGISREVNNLSLSLEEMNDYSRPHYSKRDAVKKNVGASELMILFNSETSPFWYRGYYKGTNQMRIIDSTLRKFNVHHIITGHTIVSDTISTHFDGRVINVDTKHAEGKSEALLINENKFFRVDTAGRAIRLY